MKALLKKTFEWVDIETGCVFDNQYNTATKRIMDGDIIRLYEDIRILNPECCRCKWCGKQFLTKADWEKHVEEERAKVGKDCCKCLYGYIATEQQELEKVVDGVKPEKKKASLSLGEEGDYIVTTKTKYHYTMACSYENSRNGCKCTHEEHGRYGVETFEKAYFVRHPYGDLFDDFWKKKVEGGFLKRHGHKTDGSETVRSRSGKTRTYNFEINAKNLDWKIVIPRDREEVSGKTFIRGGKYWNLSLVCDKPISKGNEFVLDAFKRYLENFVVGVKNHNEKVTDDRNYTEPDGAILESVMLKGEKVERPKPVDVSEWNWKEEE